MKKLLCLFLIAGFLSANGQQNDLIVKTTLDSINCQVRSVVGDGALSGEIKYTLDHSPNDIFSIKKSDVFYVIIGARKQVLDDNDAIYGYEMKPRYFNLSFDYSNTYFLKTGKMPALDDPHLKKVTLNKNPTHDWKYKTGKNLQTAGALMLSSVILSAVGVIMLSVSPNVTAPGFILLGAGGVSMIAGYGFIIGAGNTMQGN